MQLVLTRTIIGIWIAILINAIVYFFISDESDKELILFVSICSFWSAFFLISGYITFYLTTITSNAFLYILSMLLLVINAILILFSSISIFINILEQPLVLLFSSYLMVGYYVFYETVLDTGNTKFNKTPIDFEDDILDDNL